MQAAGASSGLWPAGPPSVLVLHAGGTPAGGTAARAAQGPPLVEVGSPQSLPCPTCSYGMPLQPHDSSETSDREYTCAIRCVLAKGKGDIGAAARGCWATCVPKTVRAVGGW